MKYWSDDSLKDMLKREWYEEYERDRQEIRNNAKKAIEQAHTGYKEHFDKKRKSEYGFQVGDLVAIKRTQLIGGKKLANEFLGPYRITKLNRNER